MSIICEIIKVLKLEIKTLIEEQKREKHPFIDLNYLKKKNMTRGKIKKQILEIYPDLQIEETELGVEFLSRDFEDLGIDLTDSGVLIHDEGETVGYSDPNIMERIKPYLDN